MGKGIKPNNSELGNMPTAKLDEPQIEAVETKYPGATTRAYRTEQIVPQAPPESQEDAPAEELAKEDAPAKED